MQVKLFGRSVDTRGMRVLLPILILFVSTSLGCPIMDELNTANEKMDEFSKKNDDEKAKLADGSSEKKDPLTRSKEWWTQAKSLDSKQLNPAIVRCRLDSGTQFMARDECLNRGGHPGRVSG